MSVGRNGLELIAEFEGKPRLKARLCEGGRYELSYGCTTWPDGRAVGSADICTEDQALQLFAFHLHRFEAVVEKYTTVPLNQNQYDAHVSLAYNIGEAQYAKSSVLRFTNEKRWDDAADAFSLFVFATSSRPSEKQRRVASLQDIIGADGRWKGPDGKPCDYFQALAGLLRRHEAEGLLSLGLPWQEACAEGKVFLDAERVWDAKQNRWEDVVTDSTPFSKVRAKAMEFPALAPAAAPKAPESHKPFDLDAYEKKVDEAVKAPPVPVDAKKPVPAPTTPTAAKPAPAPIPAPKPAPLPAPGPRPPEPRPKLEYEVPKGTVTPNIPSPGKVLENTRRFWGAMLLYGGKIFMALAVTTLPSKVAIAFGEAHGVLVRDPAVFALAIDFLTMCTGWFMDHCGGWLKSIGDKYAKGPIVTGNERLTKVSTASVSTTTTVAATTTVGG